MEHLEQLYLRLVEPVSERVLVSELVKEPVSELWHCYIHNTLLSRRADL
jgi:hypothetical protein